MKTIKQTLKSTLVVALAMAAPALANAQAPSQAGRSPEATATFAEVKKMFGVVPTLITVMPDQNVAPFWEQLKSLQLNPKTALNGKSKELIGLAVSAQIPCRYCVYAHTQFAKLNGASQAELSEALASASLARELSALSYGPEPKGSPGDAAADPALRAIHDEITQAFGTEPVLFQRYPSAALASLWRQVKAVTLNPRSALPVKTKALISLAVAAQLPSAPCVKDYTAMARANGATDQELQEAVAMAGLTRSASTALNGAMPDETQWRRDIDAIVKRVTAEQAKTTASR